MAYVDTSIREIHRALRMAWKAREEFLADADHLVGLFALAGDLSRHADVPTVAEHSPECIAGKRSRG